MPIVTVIKRLPAEPTTDQAKQLVGSYLQELMDLWTEHHGSPPAGTELHLLAFPPGAYAPAGDGAVRDPVAFERAAGGVRWAFAVTDEAPAPSTPRAFWLWTIEPDPS